jgi:hypothetical protein
MDRLLEWYPHYTADLERVRRFWQGEGRYLISVNTARHYYRQLFDDDEILRKAALNLEYQAGLPGLQLPSFYPDWGTVTTARYWGGTTRFDSTGENIFIDPLAHTLDEALALKPLPPDDRSMDAWHAIHLYRQLSEQLGTASLWLRSPDMQGTLNTAGLVMNQENMMVAMYTDKARLHALLEQVSDFLIEYARYLRAETQQKVCGNIWPYTFLPAEVGVSFTEDLMPLLSARTYLEFGIPYLKKIQAVLGAVHIHCCGDWGRHARNLSAAGLDLIAVEFHHPATTIEELEPLADGTVFIPYLLVDRQDRFRNTAEYYRYLLEHTPDRYRFWFACSEDTPELLSFAREFALP